MEEGPLRSCVELLDQVLLVLKFYRTCEMLTQSEYPITKPALCWSCSRGSRRIGVTIAGRVDRGGERLKCRVG